MGLRDAVNKYPKTVVILVVVLLVVLFFKVVNPRSSGARHGIKGEWFHDAGSEQFYIEPLHTHGPTTAPSGEEGIKAVIYTCEATCGDKNLVGKTPEDLAALNMRVAWHQKLSPEGEKMTKGQTTMIDPMMLRRYQMVRFPDDDKWRMQAEASTRMTKVLRSLCPEGKPLGCLPGVK